jgi:hypothetical protein
MEKRFAIQDKLIVVSAFTLSATWIFSGCPFRSLGFSLRRPPHPVTPWRKSMIALDPPIAPYLHAPFMVDLQLRENKIVMLRSAVRRT